MSVMNMSAIKMNMSVIKVSILVLSSVGMLFLGACGGGPEAAKTEAAKTEAAKTETAKSDSKPAATTAAAPTSGTAKPDAKTGHSHAAGDGHDHAAGDGHGRGGQIVETGDYHLEFLTQTAENGVSLDFIIGKGEAHTPVANAKVVAQVQLPDGTQQALDMTYDAGEKLYKAILPKATAGDYTVAILSEIEGKKMNSRFSFKQ
jgi:hypothetical protein